MRNKTIYLGFKNIFFSVFLVLALQGCAELTAYNHSTFWGNKKEHLIKNDRSILDNNGIVLGQIAGDDWTGLFGTGFLANVDSTRGFDFYNLETKQKEHFGGDLFMAVLPEGKYEINSLNTANNPLVPTKNGFVFSVKKGQIVYIGTLICEHQTKYYVKAKGKAAPPVGKQFGTYVDYWGSPPGIAPPYELFYVINQKENIVQKFHKFFPAFAEIEIKTDLMY